MVASSIITVASLPVYSALYHAFSTIGRAVASDFGILANTLAIAILLHRRNLVRLDELPWRELGKAIITAAVAGWLSYRVASVVTLHGSRRADVQALFLITVTWGGAVAAGLWITRSELPGDLRRRKGTEYPRVVERQAE